jgi:ureidoglycolate dehydrogenase (NAD+)
MPGTKMSVDGLQRFCVDALRRTGMSQSDAAASAEVLTMTDSWGIFTHGAKSLQGYLRRLLGGGLNPRARPTHVADGPAWAVVDGQSALGMVTSRIAMQTAIIKASTQGIAYTGVRNSCHFGAAGYYAWLAAKEGLIGIAMANDIPSVTAPGARGAVTGSNPLAYAIPAEKHAPIILDMAISTVAGGKVNAAKALGLSIPDNWIVDRDGRPSMDPGQFQNGGALLPMAGHKGYGLALLIETLSGILSGAAVTWGIRSWMLADASLPTFHGAAFLAIDPRCIAPEGRFRSRVDALIDEIHAAPKAEGKERIYVPGEREWDNYNRSLNEGIELPADVWDSLQGAARLSNLEIALYQ